MSWDDEGERETVTYDQVKKETDGAVIYAIGNDDVIVPKSQHEPEELEESLEKLANKDTSSGELSVPMWLAEDRGLI